MFSTSSEVAIRGFSLALDEEGVSGKYRQSYVYTSRGCEEEDIPTAICMHQGSLYAGYVNNNFLVQFSLETKVAASTLSFQADAQISTNRYCSLTQHPLERVSHCWSL